jgi:hypothetical protein
MDRKPALISVRTNPSSKFALGGLIACAIVFGSALAAAQDADKTAPAKQPGFFGTIKGWWDQTADTWNSGVNGMQKRFETLGHDAGVAARSTVDTAKDAADAVARLPNTSVVRGHEKCKVAPNGAPDCVAAANTMCKAKGFEGGTSLDMTTADVCPAQVYLSGRSAGEGCHTETFVSRVLCK